MAELLCRLFMGSVIHGTLGESIFKGISDHIRQPLQVLYVDFTMNKCPLQQQLNMACRGGNRSTSKACCNMTVSAIMQK